MEMTREEILTEIRQELERLKEQAATLEERLAALENIPAAGYEMQEAADDAVMAISFDDIMAIDYNEEDDLPASEEAAQEHTTEAKTETETATDAEAEEAAEDEPSLLDIFGGMDASDDGTVNARHRQHQKKALGDIMTTDEAWRTDMPGSTVRDVRSAISLNDRILFIRSLFDEDPEAFQATVAAVNAIDTFDEAVGYIKSRYPQWNYNSDTVYRFMMAIRRKTR